VSQVSFCQRLAADFDRLRPALVEKLARIRHFYQSRARVVASYVGAPDTLPRLQEHLGARLDELRRDQSTVVMGEELQGPATRTGLAAPADVAFVAQAFPAVGMAHPDAPVLMLLTTQLSFGYLWEEIRVKRGAYGARAAYQGLDGQFLFTSYRDPCIHETLQAYAGVPEYVARHMDLSAAAVEQAIIGSIKALDHPIRPGPSCGLALTRFLHGTTQEFRRAFRERLLEATADDIRRVAGEILAPALAAAATSVLASREKLEEANQQDPERAFEVQEVFRSDG
jgi:hypothetical protein